jgi:hypothetical protein
MSELPPIIDEGPDDEDIEFLEYVPEKVIDIDFGPGSPVSDVEVPSGTESDSEKENLDEPIDIISVDQPVPIPLASESPKKYQPEKPQTPRHFEDQDVEDNGATFPYLIINKHDDKKMQEAWISESGSLKKALIALASMAENRGL